MRMTSSAGGRRAWFSASVSPLCGGLVAAMLLPSPGAEAMQAEGSAAPLGSGFVTTFAETDDDGTPRVVGVRFEATALEGLAAARNLTSRCFDLDGDAKIGAQECDGDTEIRLPLPREVADREDVPLKWLMLNWHPEGHLPGPWQVGHFDLHFYMLPEAELDQIAVGPCGLFMDCKAFERAMVPVPAAYVHPDHINVDAAVGLMGNHLIDSKTPELNDPNTPFTHTWIYGAYDGRIVFDEVMLTRDHLLSRESGCYPIKLPAQWQTPGWHPTSYCIRHDPDRNVHEVTLEEFVLREAS